MNGQRTTTAPDSPEAGDRAPSPGEALEVVVLDTRACYTNAVVVALTAEDLVLRYPEEAAPVHRIGRQVLVEIADRQTSSTHLIRAEIVGRSDSGAQRQYALHLLDPPLLHHLLITETRIRLERPPRARASRPDEIPVTIDPGSTGGQVHGHLWDLSEAGMSFALSCPEERVLAETSHVGLSFCLPPWGRTFRLSGRIRHRTRVDEGCRYGVEFEPAEGQDFPGIRAEIREFVRRRTETAGRPVTRRSIHTRAVGALLLVASSAVAVALLTAQLGAGSPVTTAQWLCITFGGLLIVALAVWVGRKLALDLTSSIRELIAASEEIGAGQRDIAVNHPDTSELAALSTSLTRLARRTELLMSEAAQAGHLEEAQRARARLASAKEEILAVVSHELRTPLTNIRSFADILLNHCKDADPDTREEFLQIIKRESVRLGGVIDQFLDLARMRAGTASWVVAEMDLVAVVESAVAVVVEQSSEPGPEVVTTLPRDPCLYPGDADRIRQAVASLVQNSIKFSPQGSEVIVSLLSTTTDHELRIADAGPGVPDEHKERIFENFVQGGSLLTDRPRGAGLGLSITREIVHAHGGRVRCYDRGAGGAVFLVTLPRTPEAGSRPVDMPPEGGIAGI